MAHFFDLLLAAFDRSLSLELLALNALHILFQLQLTPLIMMCQLSVIVETLILLSQLDNVVRLLCLQVLRFGLFNHVLELGFFIPGRLLESIIQI